MANSNEIERIEKIEIKASRTKCGQEKRSSRRSKTTVNKKCPEGNLRLNEDIKKIERSIRSTKARIMHQLMKMKNRGR